MSNSRTDFQAPATVPEQEGTFASSKVRAIEFARSGGCAEPHRGRPTAASAALLRAYLAFSIFITVIWPLMLSAVNFTLSPAFTVFS